MNHLFLSLIHQMSATLKRNINPLSFFEPKYQHLPDCQVPGERLCCSGVYIADRIYEISTLGVTTAASGASFAVSGIVSSAT
jgi:hypothetical protein